MGNIISIGRISFKPTEFVAAWVAPQPNFGLTNSITFNGEVTIVETISHPVQFKLGLKLENVALGTSGLGGARFGAILDSRVDCYGHYFVVYNTKATTFDAQGTPVSQEIIGVFPNTSVITTDYVGGNTPSDIYNAISAWYQSNFQ